MTLQRVLLTGAFGNLGEATLQALVQRGYAVRCFDVPTKRNRQRAQRWRGQQVEIIWGDLRNAEDLRAAVRGMDVALHLAFVIPKLSVTGMESESDPARAYAINVQGSRNLLEALACYAPEAKVLFTSSLHVYGVTQHLSPFRKVTDPPVAVDHYARHKVQVESLVQQSGLTWTIFRLGASMPLQLIVDPGMFDVPLDNRIEFVYRDDVALAIVNALECEEVWGKVWNIGGGPRNQFLYGDMAAMILEALGVGMLPQSAFATAPYPTDWLDTEESQRVLQYQEHLLDDYVIEMRKKLSWRRTVVRIFRPIVRWWLLRQSPYIQKSHLSLSLLLSRAPE